MNILIEKLKDIDAESLYRFEMENRTFFEEMVPSRGDDYYTPAVFKVRHQSLLKEQIEGTSYFYLIKDESGSILGRINVVGINEYDKIGNLGYRVGENHTGKGVAKNAVKLLVEIIGELDVKKVKAKTTSNNSASQKVLEQNGFCRLETSDDEFEMNGQVMSFVNYIWTSTSL